MAILSIIGILAMLAACLWIKMKEVTVVDLFVGLLLGTVWIGMLYSASVRFKIKITKLISVRAVLVVVIVFLGSSLCIVSPLLTITPVTISILLICREIKLYTSPLEGTVEDITFTQNTV